MEIVNLPDCSIKGNPTAIEFSFAAQRARKPWRLTLGVSQARLLAYSLLIAAERAERAESS
jgi:hypothetical protein